MDVATFLTPELLKYAEHRVARGDAADIQAYLRSLVLAEREREAGEWLVNMVEEAEASGLIDITAEGFTPMIEEGFVAADADLRRQAG